MAAPGAAGANGMTISQSLASSTSVGSSNGAHSCFFYVHQGTTSGLDALLVNLHSHHLVHTGSSNGSVGASHDSSNSNGSHKGGQWETFHFRGGLKEYVQYNNRDNATLHEPICISRMVR